MSLLIATDLRKHYGSQAVLRGLDLQIDPGERLGLVGRNGGGKTTLLRVLEGLEAPDGGKLVVRKGLRLGHVPQIPEFEAGITVRAHVEGGMARAHAARAEVEALALRMDGAHGRELERLIHEHEAASERLQRLGGWEIPRRVESVLTGIGLPASLWEREACTLSGGEKSRAALARELVAGHELLLLDEPTNHLDLAGIEWLESWLGESAGAVLIVSHDRRLLSNAVDAILELERGELRRYPGNYAKYLALRAERFESELRAWQNQQDMLERGEAFIKKHMGSQRTAEAKGRQKKLEHVVRLERPHHDLRKPRIPAPKAERGGELVLEAQGLAGGHAGRALFSGLDLRLGRGQRIGIVGPNGAGKSTLLKILAGRLAPMAGTLRAGHKAACGYYDQETSGLDDAATPYQEIRRGHPQMSDIEIRSHLARFLFRGDEVERPVEALSGGERARLCLAKLLLEELTWLAMDEPTNHLDLASRSALEETLGGFDGTLVFVSHDREFLDGLCTHILEVGGGNVRAFNGNYSAWRRVRAEEEALSAAGRERAPAKRPEPEKRAPTGAKPSPPGRVRNPYQFEKLEKRIMELEQEQKSLHASLEQEQTYRDPQRLKETQLRLAEVEDELSSANAQWEAWIR